MLVAQVRDEGCATMAHECAATSGRGEEIVSTSEWASSPCLGGHGAAAQEGIPPLCNGGQDPQDPQVGNDEHASSTSEDSSPLYSGGSVSALEAVPPSCSREQEQGSPPLCSDQPSPTAWQDAIPVFNREPSAVAREEAGLHDDCSDDDLPGAPLLDAEVSRAAPVGVW